MSCSKINECLECGRTFEKRAGLHIHIGSHDISLEKYYHRHFPRYDALNGQIIPFKDYADYSSRFFISKKSEYAFFATHGYTGKGKPILDQQMAAMVQHLGRFPTYCEWVSSKRYPYDMIRDFDKLYSLWFTKGFSCDPVKLEPTKDAQILIDTREQQPLFTGQKTAINVGDYTFSGEDYPGINIDRKAKADFIATFASNIKRFEKEVSKAKSLGVFLVVLVEESFDECYSFEPPFTRKQKADGKIAFANVRKLMAKFDNLQFLFVRDRDEARKYVPILLSNPRLCLLHDLQFLYKTRKI